MLKRNIVIILLILLCITGCRKESDIIVVSNNTTEIMLEELVSEEYFLDYYGITREDIGDFDLQAMIEEVGITKEVLDKDGDFWLNRVYDSIKSGKKYGYNADALVRNGRRQATKEDDLSTAKYILMSNYVLYSDGFHHPQQIIIDLEKGKSYYSEVNVWEYFYDAEVQKDLDQETIDELIKSLEKKIIYKWKASAKSTGDMPGDYICHLYIVMDRGDVIEYEGYGLGNSNKKFASWYNEVLEVVQ
ncbi:MAG: hypothetical protein IJO70_07965 [Lachnospiraceae bacterium]|nr:hypothetical protein [Lachnospiraceae bacterium]